MNLCFLMAPRLQIAGMTAIFPFRSTFVRLVVYFPPEADPSFFAKASKGRGPAKLLLSKADPPAVWRAVSCTIPS